mgnify:CR=1 FL=1
MLSTLTSNPGRRGHSSTQFLLVFVVDNGDDARRTIWFKAYMYDVILSWKFATQLDQILTSYAITNKRTKFEQS